MNAIQVGMAGKTAMLRAIFGGAEPKPVASQVSERPLTPGLFRAMFG